MNKILSNTSKEIFRPSIFMPRMDHIDIGIMRETEGNNNYQDKIPNEIKDIIGIYGYSNIYEMKQNDKSDSILIADGNHKKDINNESITIVTDLYPNNAVVFQSAAAPVVTFSDEENHVAAMACVYDKLLDTDFLEKMFEALRSACTDFSVPFNEKNIRASVSPSDGRTQCYSLPSNIIKNISEWRNYIMEDPATAKKIICSTEYLLHKISHLGSGIRYMEVAQIDPKTDSNYYSREAGIIDSAKIGNNIYGGGYRKVAEDIDKPMVYVKRKN